MTINEVQQPEIPKYVKFIIHIISILLIPVILSLIALNEANHVTSILIGIILYAIPFTVWYVIAGGFNWKPERLSTFNIILFLLVTGALWGLILYGYWYLVRWIVAEITKTPMSSLKGKMFTRDSTKDRMKNLKNLLDDGLISEEEYETKKKEILVNV